MRGLIHHLDLTAKDPRASKNFYDAVLGFMGYSISATYDHGYDWNRAGAPFHSIGLVEARGDGVNRAHDRYSPGLHHVAWSAESRADVDAMYALLVRIGANVLYPPADYPEYGEGYYAVFFADPDGLKLEFVFKP